MGKSSEAHELANGDLHLNVVRLGEHGEPARERPGVPRPDGAAVKEHVAVLGRKEPCGDPEHRGLARAVPGPMSEVTFPFGMSSVTSSTTGMPS